MKSIIFEDEETAKEYAAKNNGFVKKRTYFTKKAGQVTYWYAYPKPKHHILTKKEEKEYETREEIAKQVEEKIKELEEKEDEEQGKDDINEIKNDGDKEWL